ncbi:hypothetical protein INS49_004472 [Diaporthe citri]|uniref:uncharacterized protein n=1 Tax=Diaporthe citri TaxID=83186 RepID=UPI001C7F9956|nr:uncharacterized protein INS49_004472 [Diaporthe citri]KAG6354455.1 hypothetical protein INS49_004472 [Diaporthe citri]
MPSAVAVDSAPPALPTGKMTPPLLLQPAKLDEQALETASNILGVISRYRLSHKPTPKSDEGDLKFLAQIYSKVRAGRLINMCLPAFPFKSPNSITKVLGYLPDKAEEVALAHLNGLCDAIKNIYSPGSELTIISDGLVYNDLLGVPDRNVWAYGEALRAMSAAKEFNNIKFNRLKDLVHVDVPDEMDEITYVTNATNFRLALLNSFSKRDYDVDLKIADHEDTCLTYRGYLKFLETDLQTIYPITEERSKKKYKKGLGYIAKQMLFRGDAFARAVRETFSDHIRLSIHPSTAFRLDGTVTSGLRADFENDSKLELVYEDGRPSYFREKSDLLSWAEEKGGIICEPIYPAGIIIRPALGPGKLSIHDVDSAKVRSLSEINSPIIMRGFSKTTDRDLFVAKSEELGKPLPWKFGLVLEVKDRGADTRGLNNVLSAEWMPFHYDGLFQLFTGVTSSPKDTGYTLFSSSTLVFKYLPADLDLAYLRTLTWGVSTSSFDAARLRGLPLVIDHPTTGAPCLRYHEPWPQSKTAFDPTCVTIEDENGPIENNDALCAVIDSLLHDRRVAYWHSWDKGDLVVSDNILMMHTRSDFTAGCDRELWRIHFD